MNFMLSSLLATHGSLLPCKNDVLAKHIYLLSMLEALYILYGDQH